VNLTLEKLRELAKRAREIGTQDAFIDVALAFAEAAVAEVGRLRESPTVPPPALQPYDQCRVRFCPHCGAGVAHRPKAGA
jgi:hypothetical protein